MGSLEAAMQAIMAQLAVAVTVAWLLMEDLRNFGRHLVSNDLVLVGKVDSTELIAT